MTLPEANNLLYIRIKEQILNEIKSLKPHDRLPSRTTLQKKYNVTRTTIERAISELIGEGVLYARDGSGTYVADLNNKANYKHRSCEGHEQVYSWGVILPNITHDTYPGILRGIEDVANKNDINVIICNTDNYIHKQEQYIKKLIKSDVKGVIIVPAIIGEIDSKPFYSLWKNNIPFVFCNRGIGEIDAPKILSNNFYGSYIATKHLINSGYKSIAFISRPYYSTSYERLQGYLAALSEYDMELNNDLVIFEKSFEEARPGYDSTISLIKKGLFFDAITCFNDAIAEGAYNAITSSGKRVGADIGLVGYDNTSICECLPEKLTSVSFKTYEIGYSAAEMLLKVTQNNNLNLNKAIILKPELVIRESSIR